MRRLSSVPPGPEDSADPADPAETGDEVYDHEADQKRAAEIAEEQAPVRQVARGGRRPAVPAWDDIVFGARKRD